MARLSVLLVLACAGNSSAEPEPGWSVKPEITGNIAIGRLFRIEDRSFGDKPSIGGTLGLRLGSRLGMEFEMNEVLGVSLDPAVCGIVGLPCVGSARQGMRSARVASGNLLYYFGGPGIQLYVIGGAGALWSREVTTLVRATPTQATARSRSNLSLLRLSPGFGYHW